jgi:hypothetical protein
MLKITPQHHLNHPKYTQTIINLYSVAKKNNDENMLNLMDQYNNVRCKDDLIQHVEHPVLLELLVSCISGNGNSVKRIMDVKFKSDDVCNKLKKNNEYTRKAMLIIGYALDFATFYDAEQCILPWNEFFKNPEVDYMIKCLLDNACKFKSKKAFRALLQQKNDINKIEKGRYNDTDTLITIKNQILGGTVWGAHEAVQKDTQYRNEIEAIFNEYGAKTYEELRAEKNSQA